MFPYILATTHKLRCTKGRKQKIRGFVFTYIYLRLQRSTALLRGRLGSPTFDTRYNAPSHIYLLVPEHPFTRFKHISPCLSAICSYISLNFPSVSLGPVFDVRILFIWFPSHISWKLDECDGCGTLSNAYYHTTTMLSLICVHPLLLVRFVTGRIMYAFTERLVHILYL